MQWEIEILTPHTPQAAMSLLPGIGGDGLLIPLNASLCLLSLVTYLLSKLLSSSSIYDADPIPLLSEVPLFSHSSAQLAIIFLLIHQFLIHSLNEIFRMAPTCQKENYSFTCSSILRDYCHLHSSNRSTRTLVTDENDGRVREATLRSASCTWKQSYIL